MFLPLLYRWFKKPSPRPNKKTRQFQPRLELLEDRQVLTTPPFSLQAGFSVSLSLVGQIYNVKSFAGVGFQENEVAQLTASLNGSPDPNTGDYQVSVDLGNGKTTTGDLVYLFSDQHNAFFAVKAHAGLYAQAYHGYQITVTVKAFGISTSGQTAYGDADPMPNVKGLPGQQPNATSPVTGPLNVQMSLAGTIYNPQFQVGVTPAKPQQVAQLAVSVGGLPDPDASDIWFQVNDGVDQAWSAPAHPVYLFSDTHYAFYQINWSHVYTTAYNGDPVSVYVNGPDGTSVSDLTAYADVAPAPSLAVNPASLNLGTTTPGKAGYVQTYSITGSNLLGNVTITAPAGVELSDDGGNTYQTSLTLPEQFGFLGATIGVRISAGATPGSITGLITDITPGAEDDVSVTGAVVKPMLTVTPASLNLGTTAAGKAGTAHTYTVHGTNLVGSVRIVAPANVEISTDGKTYEDSLTLPQTNGAVNRTIWVRIMDSAEAGSIDDTITDTSAYADEKDVSVTGTVTGNSTTWSGYVINNATNVTAVGGTWVQPSVTGAGALGIWVGIDGYGASQTVEQIGVHTVVTNGVAKATPFIEFFGDASAGGAHGPYYNVFPIQLENQSGKFFKTVSAGDAISAAVALVPGTTDSFEFWMTDRTRSGSLETFHEVFTATYVTPARTSAEWIVENPNNAKQTLATFTPVRFTGAWAQIDAQTGPISSFSWIALDMSSPKGHAVTSLPPTDSLTPGFHEDAGGFSSSFQVTWTR